MTSPGSRSATRRTFRSSSIRLDLVWMRPAVSASTRSAPRAAARWTASKITELGSPPSWPWTTSAPVRSPQIPSCWPAAARKVSPGGEHDALARVDLPLGQLADGGGLAHAVDPDEEPHRGAVLGHRQAAVARQAGLDVGLQGIDQGVGALDRARGDLLPQAVEQGRGRADADVGGEQRLLELVPDGAVEGRAGAQRAHRPRPGARGSCRSGPRCGPAPRRWRSTRPRRGRSGPAARAGARASAGPRCGPATAM